MRQTLEIERRVQTPPQVTETGGPVCRRHVLGSSMQGGRQYAGLQEASLPLGSMGTGLLEVSSF